MRGILKFGGHLIASLFLFYLLGMSGSLLLMQSRWIDMRLASEYLPLVSMGIGLWCYFVTLFMDAPGFAWWAKKKAALAVIGAGAAVVLVTTVPGGGLSILPAYVTRKAWLLEGTLSLAQMNVLLLFWLAVGAAALTVSWRVPLAFAQGAPMQWRALTASSRAGILFLVAALGLFAFFYLGQGEFQRAVDHAVGVMKKADVQAFRDYLLSFGPLAAIVSALLMIFQSLVAPLPAFVITFSNGLLFGWAWGAVLSWSSAMAGAVVCFYVAKFFGRPVVEKLVSRTALEWWDGFFQRYGKHSIFLARLIPVVSFDFVSYAAGVTSIPFWHFFWATGLGQLPATLLYSYLGQTATGTVQILFLLFTIVIALAVIGVLLRPKLRRFGERRHEVNE
ncbi:hypothetical protein BSNK01_16760 [Bacillaceae bacterium]